MTFESPTTLQIILGFLTLVTAISVVIGKNPVVCAIMLMATLFLTGGLYFGMGYFFLGAVQILIYAGAISVLFVFIVMLLDMKPMFLAIPGRAVTTLGAASAAVLVAAGLFLGSLGTFSQTGSIQNLESQIVGAAKPSVISLHFLSQYQIPFQVAGLLILGAVMGAIVLGKPKNLFANPDLGDKN
jgi:NADH-quinone oxidoreductase subunit J